MYTKVGGLGGRHFANVIKPSAQAHNQKLKSAGANTPAAETSLKTRVNAITLQPSAVRAQVLASLLCDTCMDCHPYPIEQHQASQRKEPKKQVMLGAIMPRHHMCHAVLSCLDLQPLPADCLRVCFLLSLSEAV